MLFFKSRRMAAVCILLSILCTRLSMSRITCFCAERCFLNNVQCIMEDVINLCVSRSVHDNVIIKLFL